ncbi:MAG: hypothetical protein ACXAD7_05245 [Candidatus Kariarchaeaceae archaeon]|jgi:hypothetical protein
MMIEKYALVEITRSKGPILQEQVGFKKEEENNILLYALPTGEVMDGSIKLIRIQELLYVSYTRINTDDVGLIAVIAVDMKKFTHNPFSLSQILKDMVSNAKLPSAITEEQIHSSEVSKIPFQIKGVTHIIASLLLLQRVIVVGNHEDIVNFIGTIYETLPLRTMSEIIAITHAKYPNEQYNLQGVPNDISISSDLDKAQKNSTIVFLDEKKAFGMFRSPITDEMEKFYLQGDFETVKNKTRDFVSLALLEKIDSSGDYAKKHNIKRSDAKLMKNFQQRVRELERKQKKDPFFRGLP